jgi:hypothetical protein
MAIDFPSTPTAGQEFGGYYWDDTKEVWRSQSTNRGSVITSATTPTGATAGDMWFSTVDGTMYVYYDDGITEQWVEIQANVDNYKAPSQNYIINGAFDFWQRGTSFSLTGAPGFQYTADRWMFRHPGPVTTTVSRQTFTPGAAPVAGYEGRFFLRGNSDFDPPELMQRIEDVRTLAGKTVTVSFWAKSASNQNISIRRIQSFGTGGSTQTSVNLGLVSSQITTSWQRVFKTFEVPSVSGRTIGEDSWLGIIINAEQTNVALDIWGVQLEEGTIATPFRRNQASIEAELASCQRYYQRLTGNTNAALGSGNFSSSTSAWAYIPFPTTMRQAPVLDGWSSLYFTDRTNIDATVSALPANSTQQYFSPNSAHFSITNASGGTTNRPGFLCFQANGFIAFTAEL